MSLLDRPGLELQRSTWLEEACQQERDTRQSMTRAAFTFRLAFAGLLGMLDADVLAAR